MEMIDKFFKENKEIKPYYEEVSRKLLDDGCYSLHIHYVQTIEKLLEVISDLRSEEDEKIH